MAVKYVFLLLEDFRLVFEKNGEEIQLHDRGMSQKEFAARMDMSEKHISKLINAKRGTSLQMDVDKI